MQGGGLTSSIVGFHLRSNPWQASVRLVKAKEDSFRHSKGATLFA